MPRRNRSRSRSTSTTPHARRTGRSSGGEMGDIHTALRDLRRATRAVNQFLENERPRNPDSEGQTSRHARKHRDTPPRRSRSRPRDIVRRPVTPKAGASKASGQHKAKSSRYRVFSEGPQQPSSSGAGGRLHEDDKYVRGRQRTRSPRATIQDCEIYPLHCSLIFYDNPSL